jgi:hypothetical protein
MEFDPHKLEAILDLLATAGVEEFEGYGFHVRFTERMFGAEKEVTHVPVTSEARSEPVSNWEDPRLWPGGKAPRYPK